MKLEEFLGFSAEPCTTIHEIENKKFLKLYR